MLVLYWLLSLLAPVFALMDYLTKAVRNASLSPLKDFLERIHPSLPSEKGGALWLHAVSLGEAKSALKLLPLLLEETALRVHLTTTTPTGFNTLKSWTQKHSRRFSLSLMPLDAPYVLSSFIRRLSPLAFWSMETEIWPNTLRMLSRRSIPCALVSARLSQKSARAYALFPSATRRILNYFSLILCQHESDAKRFRKLGFQGLLSVVGFMKFDEYPKAEVLNWAGQVSSSLEGFSRVWCAGSSRKGEEPLLLNVHEALLKEYPESLLIWVPRHLDRTSVILELASEKGIFAEVCEDLKSVDFKALKAKRVRLLVVNAFGQSEYAYAASGRVFIGGSLVPTGGQNPIEPLLYGKKVLMGPSRYNFSAIARELERVGALESVDSPEALARALIETPATTDGQALFKAQQGATRRSFEALMALVSLRA